MTQNITPGELINGDEFYGALDYDNTDRAATDLVEIMERDDEHMLLEWIEQHALTLRQVQKAIGAFWAFRDRRD